MELPEPLQKYLEWLEKEKLKAQQFGIFNKTSLVLGACREKRDAGEDNNQSYEEWLRFNGAIASFSQHLNSVKRRIEEVCSGKFSGTCSRCGIVRSAEDLCTSAARIMCSHCQAEENRIG